MYDMNVVCVECGSQVPNLYVEFSQENIKLTRCLSCNLVADKYIEYELVLVVIDIILHRIQAYRHILFNRVIYGGFPVDIRLIVLGNVLLNFLFKLVIFHDLFMPTVSNAHIFMHLLISTIVEHVAFATCIFMSILAIRGAHTASEAFLRKLYVAISFPEPLCKVPLLVLLSWDRNLGLLILVAILSCSIQLLSLQSVVSIASIEKIATSLFFAILVKVACRFIFFSFSDTLSLGIFM